MEITISVNDWNELEQIERLAKKLGLQFSRNLDLPQKKKDKSGMLKLMEEMAAAGGIQSIKDPIEWQLKVRKDRILPGRII